MVLFIMERVCVMKKELPIFSQDNMLSVVRQECKKGLKRHGVIEIQPSRFGNIDCIMSGLSVFVFKYPSLLKFDKDARTNNTVMGNLKRLFSLDKAPSDSYVRERLDEVPPHALRTSFTGIFRILQRGKILERFQFYEGYYLVSGDGTGVFSSQEVHCPHCCVKNHKDGSKTYYHQIMAASIVHPEKKTVIPLCPEPILRTDGAKKNDCERNATKRMISDIRREHPFLKIIFLADGLAANAPLIRELQSVNMRYLLVAKDDDHKYLKDWVEQADRDDAPIIETTLPKGIRASYRYMNNVPLNASNDKLLVNVIIYQEIDSRGKKRKWMWVTDINVNEKNVKLLVKGGRARWKIENETFNTLKNQGYNFEHNYGHGNKYLNQVFAFLMLIAFLIDQCLQEVNIRFKGAYEKSGSKKMLWGMMLFLLETFDLPNFESLYQTILSPPKIEIKSVV